MCVRIFDMNFILYWVFEFFWIILFTSRYSVLMIEEFEIVQVPTKRRDKPRTFFTCLIIEFHFLMFHFNSSVLINWFDEFSIWLWNAFFSYNTRSCYNKIIINFAVKLFYEFNCLLNIKFIFLIFLNWNYENNCIFKERTNINGDDPNKLWNLSDIDYIFVKDCIILCWQHSSRSDLFALLQLVKTIEIY